METTPKILQIRLDKTKYHSHAIGDRIPGDPHYRVAFMQGGLPFDIEGILLPDDGKTEPWTAMNADNKLVTHYPLYDPKMRKLVADKMARLNRQAESPDAPIEIDGNSDESERMAASDDVNLESWLRGEIQYQAWKLFAAAKKRFGKNYTQLKTLVEDLVLDEKIVPEDQVCDGVKAHLTAKAA